jgi:F-type H+-transporting ATPase subunit epsilon
MNELKLKILTPQDGIFFTGMVETVNVKTITGSLGIYYLHTPVIANLKISPLMYRFQGKEY